MRFLFFILFFCFRSFSINQNSLNTGESCESAFQTIQNYISDVLKEKDKKLPSSFHRRIDSWSSNEARQFLDILSDKIGSNEITPFLQKRSSFFQEVSYDDFKEKLEFYEQYIGQEFSDKQLAQPTRWTSMFKFSLKKIQRTINAMEELFGKERTLRILRNDVRIAANGITPETELVYDFVVQLFGEEWTDKLLENRGHSFGLLRINRIKLIVKLLMEKVGLNTEDIKLLFFNYLTEIAETQFNYLESLVSQLVSYMGQEKLRYLINNSFSAIYSIHRTDIKPVIEFIEGHLGKDAVIEKLQFSLSGFKFVSKETLEELEQEWGQDKMRDNLEKYGLRNPIFQKKSRKAQKQLVDIADDRADLNLETSKTRTRLDSLGLYVDFLDEYLSPGDWRLWLRQNIGHAYNQRSMQELEKSVTAVKSILDKNDIKEMIMMDYQKFIVWVSAFLKFYPHIDKESWLNVFQSKSINQIKQISALPDIINRYAGATTLNILLERYHKHILDIDFEKFQSLIYTVENRSGPEGVAVLLYERFYIFL